ncbi:MAG: LytTR family transcriptional regulator DNA-binding domain-containing protein [Coprobacter sp.]|nr:LytTR family transcriptional regulator DNA-binding domain-containing protein [Coprobacter sp.]
MKQTGKHLIISTSNDLVRIAPEYIIYIASDGNYSTLVQTDGEMRMLSYQLGQIEKMIALQLDTDGHLFIRIGKSLIINRSYIYYINIAKQKLTLSDTRTFSHTVSASKEALKQLKELLEKEVN